MIKVETRKAALWALVSLVCPLNEQLLCLLISFNHCNNYVNRFCWWKVDFQASIFPLSNTRIPAIILNTHFSFYFHIIISMWQYLLVLELVAHILSSIYKKQYINISGWPSSRHGMIRDILRFSKYILTIKIFLYICYVVISQNMQNEQIFINK